MLMHRNQSIGNDESGKWGQHNWKIGIYSTLSLCSRTNIAEVWWNVLRKVGEKLFQTRDCLAVAYQAIHTLLEADCWDSWVAACLMPHKLPVPHQHPVNACLTTASDNTGFLVFICIYAATEENCLCASQTHATYSLVRTNSICLC